MHRHARTFARSYGFGLLFVLGAGLALAPASAATSGATLEMERDISLCSYENVVHARPRICNQGQEGKTFQLDFLQVPVGNYPNGNCAVPGPTEFSLAETQPVLVPAGACVDLHLEVTRPPGMTPGITSCFRIEAEDLTTGEFDSDQSSFYDSGAICAFPEGATATTIRSGLQVPLSFSLYNTTPGGRTFSYQIEALTAEGPPTVLLDGGSANVTGLAAVPALGRTDIEVDVSLTTFEPEIRHDLLLRDLDSGQIYSSRAFHSFIFGCNPDDSTLCLNQGRFEVKVMWRDFIGQMGAGHALNLTADTGYFWFFSPGNVEVMLKVLDGRHINGEWWVFFGALSSVEYTVVVRDTYTGESKSYHNPSTVLASVGDIAALPGYEPIVLPAVAATASFASPELPAPQLSTWPPTRVGDCTPSDSVFCVQDGRFRVEANWIVPATGSGYGRAQALTAETGYFWFFSPNNIELVLKVLDGRAINGHWWVFFGALSDVEYTLTVTDTVTGAVKTFNNPQGRLASIADIAAFSD